MWRSPWYARYGPRSESDVRCGSDIGKRCVAVELDGKGSEGVSPDIYPPLKAQRLDARTSS